MNRILEKQIRYDTDRLRADFRLMSDLVHLGLTESIESLIEGDRKKAYGVVLRDSRIDNLESSIDHQCLEFLAKHSPAAAHLRFVYSAARISVELERVGDYAETIARQAIELSYGSVHPAVGLLQEMSRISLRMFIQGCQAFLESDVSLANETMDLDKEVDAFERRIYEKLTSENIQTPSQAKQIYSLLTIANRLERVADQSCNVCEEVVYMATGEVLRHHHEKQHKILLVCVGNACRSQMAEAIGNRLAEKGNFFFASAGSNPSTHLDEGMVHFMKGMGYDLAGHKPKGINVVLPLESYDVLVTLCDEACMNFPRIPFKTVLLNWSIEDPSRNQEYEKIYQALEAHLRELINALAH